MKKSILKFGKVNEIDKKMLHKIKGGEDPPPPPPPGSGGMPPPPSK